jgi:flagella basal body P-ring formation protein FlgA
MKKATYTLILLICFLVLCLPPEAESANSRGTRSTTYKGHQSITEVQFQRLFENYLCSRMDKDKSDIIVSRFKVIGNKPVPPGKIGFQLFQKNKRGLKGHVSLVAMISVNGVTRNTVKLSGWVNVFEPVVCASRNLKRGEIVKEGDIYLARRNASRLSPKILTDLEKAVGLVAKHNVNKDTPLKDWMLERSPIVERGDLVMILAESGSLKVTVPGVVLEKGHRGEQIRVQNTMSKKEIHARVIDHSTVIVEF